MELSKRESEEKPGNLWKELDEEYQVKAIMIIALLNFYNFQNNNYFIIFKSVVSQFLLLMNQKRV
jgi:hypothetical protein